MEENLNDNVNLDSNLDLSRPEENDALPKKPKFTVLKIITAVFYALIVLFFVATFIDTVLSYDPNAQFTGLGFAVYLIVIVVYIGSIANAVPTILSVIGIILSVKKRSKGCPVSTTVFFIVFAILPYLTELLTFLISNLIFTNL